MSKHTPGPWRWEYNEKSKAIQLCGGVPDYDLVVMDFERFGMHGATPRFREDVDRMNIMHPCKDFAKPVNGREHHASWFQGVNHPDANLIAAAPDLLEALEMVNELLPFSNTDTVWVPGSQNETLFERIASVLAKAKGEPS